jgi:Fe-S oxidoreductase
MDFSDSQGILRATEKCNGSGDCRKTHKVAGSMCPSYHATKNEKDTTRGRANALREFLTSNGRENRFDRKELKEVFDLCLSCKACASECPSNVDVATLKAEFLYQYQETNGYPLRSKLFAYNTYINRLSCKVAGLTNAVYSSGFLSGLLKRTIGVAGKRSFPEVKSFDFNKYLESIDYKSNKDLKKVLLYIDEFTQYLDTGLGRDAIDLLTGLGYEVQLFFGESGRTFISKGFLKQAKRLAQDNLTRLHPLVEAGWTLVGLEPSAVLTFRDEYRRFGLEVNAIEAIAVNSFLIEEFLAREIGLGNILPARFTKAEQVVKIHNHCHQKALSDQKVTFDLLNLPENYQVSIINSGCCGMAGSFGYEKEHYEVSMKIGEQRLFPAVRRAGEAVLIAANGTSCRHQIKDGTGINALHPVSILRQALIRH